jgi:hypothetical protein
MISASARCRKISSDQSATGPAAHRTGSSSRTRPRLRSGGRQRKTGGGGDERASATEAPEGRGNNFHVFDESGQVIGHIVLLTALARSHGKPWMWLIDSAFHEGRERTYNFAATRDAAMEAFT